MGYIAKNDGGYPVITQLTGEQVYKLVESTLALKGNRGAVCNDSTLYVSSGFEMDITKTDTGYTLNGLTVDGEPMDKAAQYSVMIYSDRDWYIPVIMEEIGCEEFDSEIPSCNEYIQKRLVEEKGQLSKPSDYIIIK